MNIGMAALQEHNQIDYFTAGYSAECGNSNVTKTLVYCYIMIYRVVPKDVSVNALKLSLILIGMKRL